MGKIIKVYCEGKRGSHDYDILEKVIDGIDISIEPIKGKRGANAIMDFKEGGTVKSDFYCMFRDRDFDCRVPEEERLTFDENKTYYSYRTTIENYLFDTELFLKFINEKGQNATYRANNENDVKNIFIETAKEIKDYQAVRHTLGELRFPNSFDTTWIEGGSGHLPPKLDLDACKAEGWKLINSVLIESGTKWTESKFQSTLEGFLKLFDEDFFTQQKFLIYFQGKDFAKALTKRLPGFPVNEYYKFSKRNFDYRKFGDLVELRKLLEAKK
ncbi:MAG: hypothetical protein LBV26_06180 [Bacteroidales bacterium]|jgi:hypothetical protein|nr:hypothetical protein [Bacteroidales bacterium]